MERSQQYATNSLHTARSFIDDNSAKLGAVPSSGAKHTLDECLVTLDSHGADQLASRAAARKGTLVHYRDRKALLHRHLATIVSVAKAEATDNPGLELVKMPKARAAVGTLIQSARDIAAKVAPFTDVFVAKGLPNDFLAQLDAATTGMRQALDERNKVVGHAVVATQGIRATIMLGRKQVKILDKLVRNAAPDDALLLRGWEWARRTQKFTPAASPDAGNAGNALVGGASATPSTAPAVVEQSVSAPAQHVA